MEGKQKVALTFALYRQDALVRRETLTQDIVKVGRDAKSHLHIDDERVSRMHAVIEVASPEEISLIDLGNEPGTMVNGARVHKCKLGPGDQILLGATRIVLEKAEPVVVAAAPARAAAPLGAPAASPFGAMPTASPFGAPAPNPFTVVGATDPFTLHNPFAPPPQPARDEVPHDAPEGSYTYTLVKSAPEVPADEVEDRAASSVEVMILWDQSVLHVQHLTPPRSYYVGEEQDKAASCDFFVPSEKLGGARAPVVLAARGGPVVLVIPPGATGTIELPDQPKMTVEEAVQQGRTQPCAELAGAQQMPLPAGAKARVEAFGLTFQITTGNAGRAVAGHFQVDTQGLLYAGISLAVHAGLLAAMAFFMPPIGATDEDGITADQQYTIQQMLQAAAQKEQDEKPTEQTADNRADDKEGGTGTRAIGEEGAMGSPNTRTTGLRYGVKGPKENSDPHIARQAALTDAGNFGLIGLLSSGAGGDPSAPTAPWGRDDSLGNDPLSARGGMWGNEIGESFGGGGLGLSGVGEGGGGRGEGIGLGTIGTIGHGAGLGTGSGIGSGHGHVRGGHRAKSPTVRPEGTTITSGRIPPEVIQRIVRQNFGRFRLCYENGLRNSPNLQGRVSVRFVIGRDGAVSNVSNGGSDMPDGNVVSCVVRSFYGLSFPQPDGGIVTVTYPIMFAPGG
jgi:hypothetical protein